MAQLLIAPGERADVIVDFTNAGRDDPPAQEQRQGAVSGRGAPDPQTTGQIMQFRVGTTVAPGRRP